MPARCPFTASRPRQANPKGALSASLGPFTVFPRTPRMPQNAGQCSYAAQ